MKSWVSLGRWTSQRLIASVLVAMAALVLAGAVLGAEMLARTAAVSNRLADRISPARTAVVELDAALREQESGIRGYLLSGRSEFLDAYRQGVAGEQVSVERLERLLTDEPALLADLAALRERADRWRRAVADPAIRQPPAAAGDRVAFDGVRERVAALDDRLVEARQTGREALDQARRVRDSVFLALIVLLLAFIGSIAVLLRLAVLRPLKRLGGVARRVAGGDFTVELAPQGPADVAELGRDVEAMRRRLVDSLQASHRAQAELERRELELRRSNADLEQFAYVASHDLQEPLRKVASFCQILQRRYGDQLDDRAQQYIGFAVDGATRMQRLISDLLAFSRIGRVYDSEQTVDLNEVLDQAEQALALAIEESGAQLSRPRLPTVSGDPTLLGMLWQNLIGNAVKFRHPDRAPRIVITAAREGEFWTFAVRDNGIGIEPEFADKIFVIFQRLHGRDRYSGTGIGLAVCKKVVEHHGGTIRLDPAHRDGACLVFTLPAAAADEGGPESAAVLAGV